MYMSWLSGVYATMLVNVHELVVRCICHDAVVLVNAHELVARCVCHDAGSA